jgi:cullin 3
MQYLVLQCFEFNDSITFADMCKKTGVPAQLLARQALSLAHPKVGVLKKTPNSPACEDDHVFAFNNAFQTAVYKVRVPLIASSSLAKPNADANSNKQPQAPVVSQKVMAQRKTAIDAAVLRVMKRRKEVEHNDLVREVAESLASIFTVDAAAVKLRIEGLIDQDYMERADNERSLYRYIA